MFVAGVSRAYEVGFPIIAVFQSLAALEIVNNLLGFVRGGMMASILQVYNIVDSNDDAIDFTLNVILKLIQKYKY